MYPTPEFAYMMSRPESSSKPPPPPVKFTPPFLSTDGAELVLTVPVEDCLQFSFTVKFLAGNRESGSVTGVLLPALADQPGYTPPPLTSVLSISFSTSGKPIYGVKTSSGVNAACLPSYFEAYDSYIQVNTRVGSTML